MTKLLILAGDITQQKTDAIVNAANKSLLGGGGVDGAIHKAAGPKLLEECRRLGGCETAEAKITGGYNLPAAHVIHTVGPVYGQENGNEETLLMDCYLNCLRLARQKGIKTIAFPAISTGIYGFPKDKAVKIVRFAIDVFLNEDNTSLDEIRFMLHSREEKKMYEQVFAGLVSKK
jgi:O-acetyl-ADP-ribose deacetylase (regulator of RNase III)